MKKGVFNTLLITVHATTPPCEWFCYYVIVVSAYIALIGEPVVVKRYIEILYLTIRCGNYALYNIIIWNPAVLQNSNGLLATSLLGLRLLSISICQIAESTARLSYYARLVHGPWRDPFGLRKGISICAEPCEMWKSASDSVDFTSWYKFWTNYTHLICRNL